MSFLKYSVSKNTKNGQNTLIKLSQREWTKRERFRGDLES